MVGLFSRFSKSVHRRSQSALDVSRTLPETVEVASPPRNSAAHGIETAIEFKPVEHPTEPINYDQPVKCPLPEPSILNDGRIWKERMSSVSARLRSDLPVVKEGSRLECEPSSIKPRSSPPAKRSMLPSLSAPEHDLINLLEECNLSQHQNVQY